jgi:hypothetical protein
MSFFDNKEVRKAVRMTAECGENYIRTKPGGVKETTLPHRTYFTTKLIPKLDKFIDGKNMGKMREMAEELAAAVFSDGWTAVNHHPIVNIIMGVRSLHTLRASIDTMGEEKTMDFIAALIVQHIKEIGEGRVFVVCMDGTCKGAFVAGRSRVGSTPRGETGSVRTLSNVSCVHTPTFSFSTVWSSMRLVCSHGTSR